MQILVDQITLPNQIYLSQLHDKASIMSLHTYIMYSTVYNVNYNKRSVIHGPLLFVVILA